MLLDPEGLKNIHDRSKFEDYLRKKGMIDLFKKIKINWIGIIFWMGPFLDQILDVNYLITVKFFSPVLLWLYLFSFFASFLGLLIYTFHRFRSAWLLSLNMKGFLNFMKGFLIFLSYWLKINELWFLLGFKNFTRNWFFPRNKNFQWIQFLLSNKL